MIQKPVELLETMVRIRAFEQHVDELFQNNELPGFVHLYIGQEAVATGACAALDADDYITSTHRGHGHCIAKGLDTDRMMAELFAKETGYGKGRGGSMHIANPEQGMLGANGIVGAGTTIATGAGLSLKQQGSDEICLSFFGDGAMSQGVLYESLNFAVVQNLPVVYICENNQYGEMTPATEQHDVETFELRGPAFGMQSERVDGMDVAAVYEAVDAAVERARAGRGPSLLVCDTYRFDGHYVGDPAEYRPDDEERQWKERDPIKTLSSQLVSDGTLSEEEVEQLRADAEAEMDDAVAYGRESDLPDPDDATKYIYAEEL